MSVNRETLWLWTVMVFGVGSKRLWEMSDNYDDIFEFAEQLKQHGITSVSDAEYERADNIPFEEAERILDKCSDSGVKYLCYESEGYPRKLRRIANPPAMLFYKGNLDFLNDKCIINVVGTRKPSSYSLEIADKLCEELIKRNILLSSGFADGIDQRVNAISLSQKSFPVAVCGTPVDQDYPKGSIEFKELVAQNGVVISEYYPECRIHSGSFAARNRISVGLSDGVLFIEAGRESHGLDNYTHAVYQGKPVFVVPPHDIYDKRYYGQRDLLRNECQPVFDADDIVYTLANGRFYDLRFTRSTGEFNLPVEDSVFFGETEETENKPKKRRKRTADSDDKRISDRAEKKISVDYSILDETQSEICRLLEKGDMLADEISSVIGLEISEVLALLTELELEGVVKSLPGKMFGV